MNPLPQIAAPGAPGGGDSGARAAGYSDYAAYQQAVAQQHAANPNPAQSFGTTGVTNPAAPTFDLVAATNAAYNTPEISAANKAVTDANTELTTRQQALVTAQSEINDNPFYAEATRVGKQQQLTQQANADMTVIQNKIKQSQDQVASLKADAAIKVNAAQGQYNINEQAYKTNLDNFNNLLSSGALDGASGNDIANLAVQTGIPTDMIQSMVDKSKNKDNPVSLIQSTDDQGNLNLISVDSTGKVLNTTQIAGAAKQTTYKGEPIGSGGGGSTTKLSPAQQKAQDTKTNQQNLLSDIKNKYTLKSLIQHYQTALSIDQIYQLYAQNSPWGAPNETLAQVKAGQYSD